MVVQARLVGRDGQGSAGAVGGGCSRAHSEEKKRLLVGPQKLDEPFVRASTTPALSRYFLNSSFLAAGV